MAKAICPTCLRLVSWRAQRGCKIKDLRCPDCKGPLERAHRISTDSLGDILDYYYGTKDGREGHYG